MLQTLFQDRIGFFNMRSHIISAQFPHFHLSDGIIFPVIKIFVFSVHFPFIRKSVIEFFIEKHLQTFSRWQGELVKEKSLRCYKAE